MVEISTNNINEFIKSHNINIEKADIKKLNAKFIEESEILANNKIDSIVSE
ncbi:hypothetical protein HOG21_02365 [bacterium]|jgi:hypothetical protein|nr:hypothetical protein [bacterium]